MFNKITLVVLALLLMATPVFAAPAVGELLAQARTAWQAGHFDQAEEAFRQAIAADPDSSDAHARLASFYLSRQRSGDAIAEYQDAIINDPENAKLFVGLAIAYLHQQSYGMAQAMVARALELNPGLANARKLSEYVEAKQRLISEAHGGEHPASTSMDAGEK